MTKALPSNSIFARLFVAFVFVVLAPALVGIVMTIWSGYGIGTRRTLDQLDSVSALKSAEIDMWTDELNLGIETLVDRRDVVGAIAPFLMGQLPSSKVEGVRDGLRRELASMLAETKLFSCACLMDASGVVRVSTYRKRENQNLGGTSYYEQGMQRRFVSSPFRDPLRGGRLVIVAARPIVAPGYGAVGVLTGYSDISVLDDIMEEPMGLGKSGESYLIGSDFSPLTRLRFGNFAQQFPIETEGSRLAVGNRVRGHGIYRDYRGIPVIGAYSWLPTLQVGLLVEQSRAEAFGSILGTLMFEIGVALVAVVLTMLAAFSVSRGIAVPLGRLADAAAEMASGQPGPAVVTDRRDEIGRLAQAFNRMTERLQLLIGELRTELAERRRTEERLRLAHARALLYFDNAAVLTVVISPRAEVIQANRKCHEALEYEAGELIDRDWFEICVPEADRAEARDVFSRLLEGGPTRAGAIHECRVVTKSGKEKVVRWYDSVLREGGAVVGVLSTGEDITERLRAEGQIRKSLAEKETLLRELHHRTKNNMGVVIAMLDLQAEEIGDERLRDAFGDTKNRIRTMALVHQKLYEAQDLSRIDLGEYLGELAKLLAASFHLTRGAIGIESDMGEVPVLIDTAIPCGLILNELVSNAVRHAHPEGGPGKLSLRLGRLESGAILFEASDDGIGFPAGFDPRKNGSLGIQTILALAEKQLGGKVRFDSDRGVSCRIEFRSDLYRPRV